MPKSSTVQVNFPTSLKFPYCSYKENQFLALLDNFWLLFVSHDELENMAHTISYDKVASVYAKSCVQVQNLKVENNLI